jgi:hypothetical protein
MYVLFLLCFKKVSRISAEAEFTNKSNRPEIPDNIKISKSIGLSYWICISIAAGKST